MHALLRDLRYAARTLVRDKGFSVTVVLTLAGCIAANTAIFAIVNSVLLRPLPVPEAGSIVLMSNRYPKAGVVEQYVGSAADYYDRRGNVAALEEQAMFQLGELAVPIGGTIERIQGMAVTPSFFSLVRVQPAQGRAFTAAEGEPGSDQKVILSYGLWQQLYAGRPAIGRELRLNGRPYTVVGVMPRDFVFVYSEVRIWAPLTFSAQQKSEHHSNNWYHIGRLRPGATVAQAQSQVDALNAVTLERFPEMKPLLRNAGFYTKVEPLQRMLIGHIERTLYLLWGGALFVLLIGAVNIANLFLARWTVRRRDIATRVALGASRAQLARHFVLESVLLTVTGGIAGLALGATVIRLLGVIGLDRFPRANEVRIDATVIVVVLAMAIVTGGAIGLAAFASALKENVNSVLHEGSRSGTAGARTRRIRRALVASQIAFAFVLLAGAGLFLASFRQLLRVDPGFRSDGVVTASTQAPQSRYANEAALRILINRSLAAIRSIPGVAAAGATGTVPLGGHYEDSVIFAEGYRMNPGESVVSPSRIIVTPGYFEAMRIPLIRGRYFEDRDDEAAPPAVIVDERLARRFWPDRDPIGQRMYRPSSQNLMKTDQNTRWLRVVGVVRAVRMEDLASAGRRVGAYYLPFAQETRGSFSFAVLTNGQTAAAARAVRREFARIDPELALFDIKSMAERTALSLASRRTSMVLAMAFGGVALLLSALGIYGVLAYLVAQRRREIGIRVALGSTAAGVVKLVMREAVVLVAAGLVLGLAGAAMMTRTLASEVYGVQPLDPFVLGGVAALLGAVAIVACVAPARRAVRVDPVTVLSE